MNRREANAILDRVRLGENTPSDRQIADALQATGDMGEVADYPVVVVKQKGTWEMKNRGLSKATWCEVIA